MGAQLLLLFPRSHSSSIRFFLPYFIFTPFWPRLEDLLKVLQDRQQCKDMDRLTVVVNPAAAVSVDVGDHVIDVSFRQVVAEILQNPPASMPHSQ